MWYGVMMANFFKSFDSERATLSDYVAVLENVPKLKGEEKVEEILKEAAPIRLKEQEGFKREVRGK